MAELKTKPNRANVSAFLNRITDEERRRDCIELVKIMTQATGSQPKMWGPAIVGFGTYHYRYVSGREGDWMLTGFSPRKQSLTLYIMSGFERYTELWKNSAGTQPAPPACISNACRMWIKRCSGNWWPNP